MDTEFVIAELKKSYNFSELYQKTTFEGYRIDKKGEQKKVMLSIFDAGSEANPQNRYHCVVRSENNKTATGNQASSIKMALYNVHWEGLDI